MDISLQISDSLLQTAVSAAEDSAEIISGYTLSANRSKKEDGTVVTEADTKAETAIRSRLNERTSFPIVGEEQGSDTHSGTYWVIDPIDGTHNFSYKNPLYGTAIALIQQNVITHAVFYMPEVDDLFYAKKGEGAYCNQDKLELESGVSRNQVKLSASGYGLNTVRQDLLEVSPWVQVLGSSIVCGSWIAAGRIEAGVFCSLFPWDVAASILLIQESGGSVKSVHDQSSEWADLQNGLFVAGRTETVDNILHQLPTKTIEELSERQKEHMR